MTNSNILQTAVKTLKILRIVTESGHGLTMTEISKKGELGDTITFRVLKTLEESGFIQRVEGSKKYTPAGGHTGAAPLAGVLTLLQNISAAPVEGLNIEQLINGSELSLPQIKIAMCELEEANLVTRHKDKRWTISPGILGYARGILQSDPTLTALRPIMTSLAEATGETITWFRTIEGEQFIVENIPSSKAISYILPVGSKYPLYKGAGGKAHLAGMSEEEVTGYFDGLASSADLPSDFNPETLLKEVSEARSLGYAVSESERVENAASVAVPVFGPDNNLAGVLAILTPAFRMPQEREIWLGENLLALTRNLFDVVSPANPQILLKNSKTLLTGDNK